MKKLKLLPSMLMLVLCVGVLAVGIFAIAPTQNTISGTITINECNAPVTITIYKDSLQGTKVAQEEVRAGKTIGIGELEFKTKDGKTADNANMLDDIAPIIYVVEFSTTSSKNLVIDTQTIEQYNGVSLTDQNTIVKENIVSVTKFHSPTATDKVSGKAGIPLAYFTNNKPYTITLTIKQSDFSSEECNVMLNMNFDIWEASKFEGVGINGVDYLYFGEYPQSEAKTTGSSAQGNLKLASNGKALTNTGKVYKSYESQVLKDEEGNKVAEDLDNNIYIDEDNNKYVEVSYCYEVAIDVSTGEQTYVQTSNTKYFLIEPLKWKILKNEVDQNGDYSNTLLMCNNAVEQVYYRYSRKWDVENQADFATNKDGSYVLDNQGNKVYSNNYEYSELREYLNNTFYNNAFNSLEKQLIKILNIDNSSKTIGTNEPNNKYACNDILASNGGDPVFALSFEDIVNTEYGFENNTTEYDYTVGEQTYKWLDADVSLTRMAGASGFAGATGVWAITLQQIIDIKNIVAPTLGNSREEIIAFATSAFGLDQALVTKAVDNGGMGLWWSRSPYPNYSDDARDVGDDGNVINSIVNDVDVGALPALHISLKG